MLRKTSLKKYYEYCKYLCKASKNITNIINIIVNMIMKDETNQSGFSYWCLN